MTSKKERTTREQLKAAALRSIAEQQWKLNDLLTIFGMAFRAKIADTSNVHNRLGKNYFSAHGKNHYVRGKSNNPSGTKLVRSFIRGSRLESVTNRKLYAQLTGRQYGAATPSS